MTSSPPSQWAWTGCSAKRERSFEHLVEWQHDVHVYLRDTPQLGAGYVDRFDRHPAKLTRSLKAIDRTESAIPQVREKQNRLSAFRDEIK